MNVMAHLLHRLQQWRSDIPNLKVVVHTDDAKRSGRQNEAVTDENIKKHCLLKTKRENWNFSGKFYVSDQQF